MVPPMAESVPAPVIVPPLAICNDSVCPLPAAMPAPSAMEDARRLTSSLATMPAPPTSTVTVWPRASMATEAPFA